MLSSVNVVVVVVVDVVGCSVLGFFKFPSLVMLWLGGPQNAHFAECRLYLINVKHSTLWSKSSENKARKLLLILIFGDINMFYARSRVCPLTIMSGE